MKDETQTMLEERIRNLPPDKIKEVLDFVAFIESKVRGGALETMLASEAVLRKEWSTPEEDEAWASL